MGLLREVIFFTSAPSLSTVEIQFGRLEGEKSREYKWPERKEGGMELIYFLYLEFWML